MPVRGRGGLASMSVIGPSWQIRGELENGRVRRRMVPMFAVAMAAGENAFRGGSEAGCETRMFEAMLPKDRIAGTYSELRL